MDIQNNYTVVLMGAHQGLTKETVMGSFQEDWFIGLAIGSAT